MRYLLFGDSIAFGVGDPEFGGWAGRARQFHDKKTGTNHFTNLAISGDDTTGLLERIEQETKRRIRTKTKEEFTIILAIGMNDTKIKDETRPTVSQETFKDNFNKILDICKKLVSRIIVLGITPVYEPGTSPFKENNYYKNERIKLFNNIIKECTQEKNLELIEMYDIFDEISEKYFPDGLHPGELGHKVMFEKVKTLF